MENVNSKEEAQKSLDEMQRAVHRMKVMHRCGYYTTQYRDEEWASFLAGNLWKAFYSSLNYSDIIEEYTLQDNDKPYGGQNHTMRSVAVIDKIRGQYLLLTVGYDSDGTDAYGVIFHIAIKSDKVIVYANNTDTNFVEEFEELGIAPIDITNG